MPTGRWKYISQLPESIVVLLPMDYTQLKLQLLNLINKQLDTKINTLQTAIASAKEARDNDIKSSMGDKYETGRAMMDMEIGKNKALLSTTLKLKQELSRIDLNRKYKKVEFGSLVQTDTNHYLIAVGLGEIKLENVSCFAISLASPIGKALAGKMEGDSLIFQGRKLSILGIY